MDELLPIGSIVVTKDKRNLMIIGYLPNKTFEEDFNEYICCSYDKGIKKEKEKLEIGEDIFYLKKEDISTVVYIGLQNYEFEILNSTYDELVKHITNMKNKNGPMVSEDFESFKRSLKEKFEKKGNDNDEK